MWGPVVAEYARKYSEKIVFKLVRIPVVGDALMIAVGASSLKKNVQNDFPQESEESFSEHVKALKSNIDWQVPHTLNYLASILSFLWDFPLIMARAMFDDLGKKEFPAEIIFM